MKLSKFDIGAEIIAILTRGIYPDPRDAIREYIQNSIDAKATKVTVEVGQDFVVVQDNGLGMSEQIMKDAIRIGVSDKQPGKDVGFMGIGIYSSFHLCDILEIYSKEESGNSNKLKISFKDMRSILSEQKEKKLQGATSGGLIGLQTLLEDHIELTSLKEQEFPTCGTRVELTGLNATIYNILSDFKKMSNYLKEVVPLHFSKDFSHGKEIEEWILKTCKEHNRAFEIIDLELNVSGTKEVLFKSYKDSIFTDNISQKPIFHTIKYEGTFIGIAWGCLNSGRKILSDKSLRGFLLKKQGFAIGKRTDLLPYFSKTSTAPYFNRYTGEIIIISNDLLPNASRSGLEDSKLKIKFDSSLRKVANEYTKVSDEFQKYNVAKENIAKSAAQLKEILATKYEYSEDARQLVDYIVQLEMSLRSVKHYNTGNFSKQEDRDDAENLKKSIKNTIKTVQDRIDYLTKIKKTKKQPNTKSTEVQKINIAKKIQTIDTSTSYTRYDSFLDLLSDLDIETSDEIKNIFNLLDDFFIRDKASTRNEYQQILQELKQQIMELLQ